jgi:hypothetical protein
MAAYHQGVLKAEFVRGKKEKGVGEKKWMNIYYDPFLRSLHAAIGCGTQPNIRFNPTATPPLRGGAAAG